RLNGKRLKGDFALVHIKARRPGSKGNEWLLIKKKDDHVVSGFDIDSYDTSVLTGRTMAQIAGDAGSAEWTSSRPASRGKVKAAWLADAIARADLKKKKAVTAERTEGAEKSKKQGPRQAARSVVQAKETAAASEVAASKEKGSKSKNKKSSA